MIARSTSDRMADLEAALHSYRRKAEALEAEIAALRQQNDRYREALRPFAAFGHAIVATEPDDRPFDIDSGLPAFTVGDCRRARRALEER